MTEIGTLDRMSAVDVATALAVNTAAGAMSLPADESQGTIDFDSDNGGWLSINGEVLPYSGCDDTTIFLTSPLPADALAGDPILSLSAASEIRTELKAWVRLDEGEEPIPFVVDTSYEGRLREDTAPGTTVEVDLDTRMVVGRVDIRTDLDGSIIDPTTLPDQVPLEAPDTVLTVTATGDASGITAVATPAGSIAGTTLIKWAIDGVVVKTTQSLVYRSTADSVGAPLVDGRTYSITAQPTNTVGDGTVSTAATGQLNSGVAAQTVLGWVAAGFLLAGTIQVGQMTLSPPTADDPGGLTIPLTNGGLIKFPADGSDAIITAVLRARSLVVENDLRVQGQRNAIEGGLQLANGTTAPTVKPRAGQSWDHAGVVLNTDAATFVGNAFGLADGGGASWYTTENFTTGKVWALSKTTGARTLALTDVADYKHIGGLCRIGTDWYVLSFKNSTLDWRVRKYNSSWVFQSEWIRAANNTFTGTAMAIATDGTFIYTAYRELTNGYLRVFKQDPDGANGSTVFTSTTVPSGPVTGFYVGSADYGTTRYVITTNSQAYVFNSSGARQTTSEWFAPNGDQMRGIVWDGTRFHTLSASGKVWHLSTLAASTSRSITHTWYDNNPLPVTTHETEASPALTYTQGARQYLRVDTDPPSFAGFPDDPNAVRIYIANQRQADLGTGVTTAIYDLPATGGSAAPTSNGFAGVSAPGNLSSGATDGLGALIAAFGSGSGRTGWNRWDTAGNLQGTAGLRSITSSNQTGIANSTWTKVTLTGTASYNEGLTVSASEVTIDTDGLYSFDGEATWFNDDATGRRVVAIEAYTGADPGVGSGTVLDRDERPPSTTSFIHGKPNGKEWLTAGTKIRLIVWQNSGSNRTIQNTTTPSKLNVVRCG